MLSFSSVLLLLIVPGKLMLCPAVAAAAAGVQYLCSSQTASWRYSAAQHSNSTAEIRLEMQPSLWHGEIQDVLHPSHCVHDLEGPLQSKNVWDDAQGWRLRAGLNDMMAQSSWPVGGGQDSPRRQQGQFKRPKFIHTVCPSSKLNHLLSGTHIGWKHEIEKHTHPLFIKEQLYLYSQKKICNQKMFQGWLLHLLTARH